jgi:hypothetical protein
MYNAFKFVAWYETMGPLSRGFFEGGREKTERRRQRSEVGGQRTEDRGQRSEVRRERTVDRGQKID